MTAGLIERVKAMQAAPAVTPVDKWEVLRDLCTARHAYEVTDRDLAVLNALVSFHPNATLSSQDGLIVFPSNNALSQRAHGMAESTLRRHLAALVRAGLIARHDSPNGKRYARRDADGVIARAFGFDLRPLLHKAAAIAEAANQARADQTQMAEARERLSLLKRDALKLALYGQQNALPGDWEALLAALMDVHKQMRRKLAFEDLADLETQTVQILGDIQSLLAIETEEMSGNDSESERQYQNSNTDKIESELSQESDTEVQAMRQSTSDHALPTVPLALILKACPDILPYCEREPGHWRDLIVAAGYVRGMMGIPSSAWQEAQDLMGRRPRQLQSPASCKGSATSKAPADIYAPWPVKPLWEPSRPAQW